MTLAPKKIRLPNGLEGSIYPSNHQKVSHAIQICRGNCASARMPFVTIVPSALENTCVLELRLDEALLYVVFHGVRNVEELEKTLNKNPENWFRECTLCVVYDDRFYYWTSAEAKLIACAIREKTSPGAYLTVNHDWGEN